MSQRKRLGCAQNIRVNLLPDCGPLGFDSRVRRSMGRLALPRIEQWQ
jgi:hypothetical protein